MTTTFQDLLHAINIFGEDRDVFVEGFEALAVCPPVKFTPAGLEHFKQALTANVIVEYGEYDHIQTYVSDDDDKINEMAFDLLRALAGYCYDDNYDAWFDGGTAEMI